MGHSLEFAETTNVTDNSKVADASSLSSQVLDLLTSKPVVVGLASGIALGAVVEELGAKTKFGHAIGAGELLAQGRELDSHVTKVATELVRMEHNAAAISGMLGAKSDDKAILNTARLEVLNNSRKILDDELAKLPWQSNSTETNARLMELHPKLKATQIYGISQGKYFSDSTSFRNPSDIDPLFRNLSQKDIPRTPHLTYFLPRGAIDSISQQVGLAPQWIDQQLGRFRLTELSRTQNFFEQTIGRRPIGTVIALGGLGLGIMKEIASPPKSLERP